MYDVKYILVLPIGEMKTGDVYQKGQPLPLSCTVLQWFRPGEYFLPDHLKERLRAFVKKELKKDHIELVSDKPALFGPNGDVPVHVLKPNPDLNLLHTVVLLHLAMHGGSVPEEPRWAGAGYRAHVTDVPPKAFWPGQKFIAKHIALLGRNEYGDRKVLFIVPQ